MFDCRYPTELLDLPQGWWLRSSLASEQEGSGQPCCSEVSDPCTSEHCDCQPRVAIAWPNLHRAGCVMVTEVGGFRGRGANAGVAFAVKLILLCVWRGLQPLPSGYHLPYRPSSLKVSGGPRLLGGRRTRLSFQSELRVNMGHLVTDGHT